MRWLLSSAYIRQARDSCFPLLMHWIACAFCSALDNAGSNIAARMAMIAIDEQFDERKAAALPGLNSVALSTTITSPFGVLAG